MVADETLGRKHPEAWRGVRTWQLSRYRWARRCLQRARRRATEFMLGHPSSRAVDADARADWHCVRSHVVHALAEKKRSWRERSLRTPD